MTDDGEALRIERQAPSDWRRVRALRLRALEDSPDAFARSAEEEARLDESAWHERLEGPGSATWLAYRGSGLVGLVVGAVVGDQAETAGVYSLWVDPAARGARVGEALCRRVIDWARARGARRIVLDVGDDNHAAVRLYERLGFQRVGLSSRPAPARGCDSEHRRELLL